jgi:hypothetical protein
MKTLVLAMTLALALVSCELALAQDSTTCITSKDGLSTRCTNADGSTFGVECYERLNGDLSCTDYHYPRPTPPISDGAYRQIMKEQEAELARIEKQIQCVQTCQTWCDGAGNCMTPPKSGRQLKAEAKQQRKAEANTRKLCASRKLPAEKCKP